MTKIVNLDSLNPEELIPGVIYEFENGPVRVRGRKFQNNEIKGETTTEIKMRRAVVVSKNEEKKIILFSGSRLTEEGHEKKKPKFAFFKHYN